MIFQVPGSGIEHNIYNMSVYSTLPLDIEIVAE